MTRPTSALTRCAITLTILAAAGATAAPAAASAGTPVPLRSVLRACDFTPIQWYSAQSDGSASSAIRAGGGTVTAEVYLSEPGSPNTHFDVRLIQAPRASNSPCGAGGPGVAVGGLDTDGAGQATTTLQDSIQSGTTGVWVFVQRPNLYSQGPAEFYTSDFIAPV
jgi:hypothetical protein